MRVVLSAYLRLLIFLPAILIPVCASSSLVYLMLYSAYKLNKQGSIYSLDVLLSQFGISLLFHVQSNCCFLICIQISQEAGQVVWYSHLFQNFLEFVVIHTVKGFCNKAELNVFLELACFFNDPTDVGNLISCSSAFSKISLNIWKFTVHVLLKPRWENFEYYFASV